MESNCPVLQLGKNILSLRKICDNTISISSLGICESLYGTGNLS